MIGMTRAIGSIGAGDVTTCHATLSVDEHISLMDYAPLPTNQALIRQDRPVTTHGLHSLVLLTRLVVVVPLKQTACDSFALTQAKSSKFACVSGINT